jgi:hypothetical protein
MRKRLGNASKRKRRKLHTLQIAAVVVDVDVTVEVLLLVGTVEVVGMVQL